MASFDLNDVIASLSIISNPISTKEARISAERFIETFKASDSLVSVSIPLVFYTSNYSYEIRTFGLHFLEHALLTRWNSWSFQQQLDFRQTITDLLLDGLSPTDSEKRLLKEKLAKLIVSISLRMWPQNWLDFRPFIATLFSSNRINIIEVGLMIVRCLAEDIFIYGLQHVDESRLNELKAALMAEAPFLLSTIIEYMENLSRILAEKSGDVKSSEALFAEAIELWSVYVGWLPFKAINETHIFRLLMEWLSFGDFVFDPILNVLTASLSRSCKVDEQLIMLEGVMAKLPAFLQYLSLTISAGYSDRNYEKLKKLAQFYHDLGIYQLTYKKTCLFDVGTFDSFLDAICTLTEHESELLASYMMEIWGSFLKNERITKDKAFVAVLPRFVNAITGKLMNLHQKSAQFKSQNFNQADFDDAKEFDGFLGVTKGKLCELIRSVTKFNHSAMLELMLRGTETLLATPYESTNVGINPIGCTVASQYYKSLESSVLFFQSVLTGIGHKVDLDVDCIRQLNSFIGNLINFPQNDPLCMTKILDPIVEASLILRDISTATHLNEVIRKVMSLVSFVPINVPIEKLSPLEKEIVTNLRKKASSCLVKLGEAFSSSFVPYFSDIFSQLRLLLDESSMIGLAEKTDLLEFLLVIVGPSRNAQERLECLDFVCKPVLEAFKAPEFLTALELDEQFFSYIGATVFREIESEGLTVLESKPVSFSLDLAQKRRQKLSNLLATSLMIVNRLPKESSDPSSSDSTPIPLLTSFGLYFVGYITPLVLRLLATVDRIYSESDTKISSSWAHSVLRPTLEEKKNLLGYGILSHDVSENDGHIATYSRLVVSFKVFLFNIRMCCYQFIAAVANNPSFYPLLGQYWTSLFSMIFTPSFPLRFWKHFIQLVVEPLILKCPVSLYAEFLSPWLPLFMDKMILTFNDRWAKLAAVTKASLPNNETTAPSNNEDCDDMDESFIDELLEERLLRSSSHALSSLLFDISYPLHERASKKSNLSAAVDSFGQDSPPQLSQLFTFMTTNDSSMLQAFLSGLLNVLSWKDSYSCGKAIAVFQRLLFPLSKFPQYANYFSNAVLTSLLRDVLSDDYHCELHDTALYLITSIISSYYDASFSFFQSIPALNSSNSDAVKKFFQDFQVEADLKKRKARLKDLIMPILGVKKSALFKPDYSNARIKSLPSKLIINQIKSIPDKAFDWNADDSTSLGLAEFFA